MPEKRRSWSYYLKYIFIIMAGSVSALILLLCVGGWLLLDSFGDAMCGNEVFQEVVSPDGRYKAVVFQRDCGVTTGFSTQISILRAEQELEDDPGNIFIMDGHPEWTHVAITWVDAETISIKYAFGYEPFKSKNSYRGIHIEYVPNSGPLE